MCYCRPHLRMPVCTNCHSAMLADLAQKDKQITELKELVALWSEAYYAKPCSEKPVDSLFLKDGKCPPSIA